MTDIVINTTLVPAPTVSSDRKNVVMFGKRNTDGDLFVANSGYPQPNYYKPFALPSFQDGLSCLDYMKKLGFQVTIGIVSSLTFPEPDVVIPNQSTTTLQWNSMPDGFLLLPDNISGTASQGVVTAQIRSQKKFFLGTEYIAQLVVQGTPAFTTSGGNVTLELTSGVLFPDPELTDPIAVTAFYFYQTSVSAFSSPLGSPTLFLSVISDRDSSITPVATPIALVEPTAVTVVDATTVLLTYPKTAANLGWLPTQIWGTSTVTQAVSNATGTFGGFTVSGSNVLITVNSVTGTFVTTATNTIEVVLDNSINGFNYLDNIPVACTTLQYPINNEDSITIDHADYFTGVDVLNLGSSVANRHYGTFGLAGNITSTAPLSANLPLIDNKNYGLVNWFYKTSFGDIPIDNSDGNVGSGVVSAILAYTLANQDAPFYSIQDIIVPWLPVPKLIKENPELTYSATSTTKQECLAQGWLPVGLNSVGQFTFLEDNTAMVNIPNTDVPDNEFKYFHNWKCIYEWKRIIAETYIFIKTLPNNQGTALDSPKVLNALRISLISQAKILGTQSVLANTNTLAEQITVTSNPLLPGQIIVRTPVQIFPSIRSLNAEIVVFSYVLDLNNLNF